MEVELLKLWPIIAAICMMIVSAARADDLTARQLIDMYRGRDQVAELGATSYAVGASTAYQTVNSLLTMGRRPLFCPPPSLKFDAHLGITTLEQYLQKTDASNANQPAVAIMLLAFMDTFACSK